jgi:hypothetical protein
MRSARVLVFLGPSLPLEEARQILDAIYLPPAKQADLLSAAINYRPDVIGLIDGVFMQSLSVWHKEILYILDQGIRLYGASSMGALRAAETAEFGMIGVGEIYRMYAEGELQDDDEVALVHGQEEIGYRKMSEPMVNVRATIRAAQDRGLINGEDGARLTVIAKSIYFVDRTFPTIFARAAAEGMRADVLQRVQGFVSTNYVDLKAQDSIQLLKTIRDLPEQPYRPTKTFDFVCTYQFETLYNRDRLVHHGNVDIPLEAIANYSALHDPDFQEVNFNALNRILGVILARVVDIEVSKDDIDAEGQRFRTRHSLVTDEAFISWLGCNDLSREEFRALMKEIALCRRLHRWLLTARWMDRNTKLVLDQLRLENRYTEWADRAACHEQLVKAGQETLDAVDQLRISMKELLADHQDWTDFQMDADVSIWAEDVGFHTRGNLKMELLRAKIARMSLLNLLAESTRAAADGHAENRGIPQDS